MKIDLVEFNPIYFFLIAFWLIRPPFKGGFEIIILSEDLVVRPFIPLFFVVLLFDIINLFKVLSLG